MKGNNFGGRNSGGPYGGEFYPPTHVRCHNAIISPDLVSNIFCGDQSLTSGGYGSGGGGGGGGGGGYGSRRY